jgi:nitroimidazol reductase NimA-like FMN-containing flavoprotein (pyridoxamine 5'-phosphate oxidase superfamily)
MLGELMSREVEHLLHTQWVARLGLHAEGKTYVVPINYTYDGTAVYGHSNDGLKLRLMRANPEVCVEVDHVENLANWKSVIAWGRFEELHGKAAIDAMQLLVARFTPLMATHATTPTHGRPSASETDSSVPHAAVFRIVLEKRTGRFERR